MRYRWIPLPMVALGLLVWLTWLGTFSPDPFTNVMPVAGAPHRDVAAVVLSGDMGFRVGMSRQVASRLAAEGIAVVGVNSLSFFHTTRTPAEATGLIEAAMQRAQALGHVRRVVLIGQSFGADMLHVGLAGLPVMLRPQVAMVALVVPGATVAYRASPGEIFTFLLPEADARPTARRLGWAPLLCIHGMEEAASLCPLLRRPNLAVIALPGGHPLHHDVDALYRSIHAAMIRFGLGPRRRATT